MSTSTPHADDLPELPELPEEHAELHELPDTAEPVSQPGMASGAPGEKPPLRVLDKAPLHLRMAALIVVGGSIVQWMPGKVTEPQDMAWLLTLLAKAIMGAAAWLWYMQILHNFGPPVPGVLGQLANLSLLPKKEKKTKGRASQPQMHLEHPFPTGLHLLALILVVVSIVVAMRDPRVGLFNLSAGVPEVALLGWAAFTWVHIAGYERWGHFNPLFPLMFIGMLIAGLSGVVAGLNGSASGLAKLMSVLGGAAVASGGGLAAYTIVEAMMQAKKDGDRKKAEALEARRAARKKA